MVNLSLEWNSYTIGESCELITGFPFKSKYYLDEGLFKVVRGDNVKEGFIKWDDKKRCWNELNDKLKKVILKEEDIVIGMDGSKLGKNRATISKKDLPALLAQRVACVRAKEGFDQNYIKYVILSNYFKSYVDKVKTGTSIPHISLGQISEFTFEAPDYKKQKTISSILSTIDKKINVNQEINKNLEELIKHIYINWFEDFEPFKGNTFHDTKLGKIPNGWNVKPLHKFIKFQEGPGIRNWQYVEEDGINFLNIRCIQNNDLFLNTANMISKEEANGKYAHFMLNEWDLVISSSGTLGRYAIVRKEHLPLCLNTSIIRFKPLHSINHYAYIYSYLTSRGFYHYLLTMGSGSVQLNFGPTHLKQIDLIVPPEDVLKRYNETVFPIIEKIVKIKAEINKLTKLRDTLLPKLMSGEIDVSKINCDLELKYNYMKYLFNQIHTPMSKSVV